MSLRENPGGNSFTGYKIISHIIIKKALLRYKVKLSRKLKSGDGVFYSLPGYNLLRVNINCGIYTNGEIWQGVGIEPDVPISETSESLMACQDVVLEIAERIKKASCIN